MKPQELARMLRYLEPPDTPPAEENDRCPGAPEPPFDGEVLHRRRGGAVNGAAILLICSSCRRTVRRQPVDGPRSLEVPVQCTPCAAKSKEDSPLVRFLRTLRRRHPKHPGTGRFLKPEEYSTFFASMHAAEPRVYLRDPNVLERFLKEELKLRYSWKVKNLLWEYGLPPDPAPYYVEALLVVARRSTGC